METQINNTESLVLKEEKLINIWGHRNPRFEKKYEFSVIRVISQYGVKSNNMTESKGKIFGPGYEPYIMAFFIGLYSNKKLPLSDDSDDVKVLGHPIENWGNIERRNSRKPYPDLCKYMFMALVARTDVDWIAVDKGDIKVSSAVTALVNTMEEYANYGFFVMEEKLKEDRSFFYSNRSFLDLFLQLTEKTAKRADDNELEEL